MSDHIELLCTQYGIRIVYTAGRRARAYSRPPCIKIEPVTTARRYAVALHEIGHLVGRGRSGRLLEREAAAWKYVLETASVPLPVSAYRSMFRYLESYHRLALRRRRVNLPAPHHEFWQVYCELATLAEMT